MSQYHPDVHRLMEHAAANLPLAQRLCIAVHVWFCDHCRQQLENFDILGATLFDQQSGAAVDDHAFAQLWQKIESQPTAQQPEKALHVATAAPASGKIPAPLKPYLPQGYQGLRWRRIGWQLSEAVIGSDGGSKIALHRIFAGGKVPSHTHSGNEFTVVLQGGFSDHMGIYNPGDFIHLDANQEHRPIAAQNEDCICLTVVDAPLRLTGWFGRYFNRWLV